MTYVKEVFASAAGILAFLTLTVPASAQPYQIRGTVTEIGTTQSVADASVQIAKSDEAGPGQPRLPQPQAELTTDAQGRFVFTTEEPGEYGVIVSKEGFAGKLIGSTVHTHQAKAVLTKARPEADLELSLGRAGQVYGRFVDGDTGEPIVGMTVLVSAPYYIRGVQLPAEFGGKQVTDEEGRFNVGGLQPGEYVIATEPFRDFERKQKYMFDIGADFDEANFDAVDQGYPSVYFPGGLSLDRALPFPVPSGGVLNVGTFTLRKVNLYDARVRIADDNCPAGTPVFATLYTVNALGFSENAGTYKSSCGGTFLVQNLPRGAYGLYARTRASDQIPFRLMTDVPLAFEGDNLDVTLFLQRGGTLQGRIVLAEGSGKIDLETLTPQLNLDHSQSTAFDLRAPAVGADGTFSQSDMRLGAYEVSMNHLPPGAYISEVRYQGSPRSRHFDFTGDGLLEIEVDTRSATLSGAVVDSHGRIPEATVVVTPWPVPAPDERGRLVLLLKSDEAGSFTALLPPGAYRVFALAKDDAYRVDLPNVLERLAGGGEKLEVNRGGSGYLMLELAQASR